MTLKYSCITTIAVSLFLLLIYTSNVDSSSKNNLLRKPGCTIDDMNRIDLSTARLLTAGPNGRSVPENFEQLKPFCAETSNLTEQVHSFIQRCYNKEIGRYVRIAMHSAKKAVKTFCGNGSKKIKKLKQLLDNANPCINKHLRKNDTCIRVLIDQLQAAFAVDDKLKLPYICCSTLRSFQCLESELNRHECALKNRELIMDFVRSNTDDLFNMACFDYTESSDKCSQLKPLKAVATTTNSTGKRKRPNKSSRFYATPVFVMIDLFSSIGNAAFKIN